jgi:hypothetical protein
MRTQQLLPLAFFAIYEASRFGYGSFRANSVDTTLPGQIPLPA